MDRVQRPEGRGPSREVRLQPMVQRLLDNVSQYEPRARVDDGLAINEVILVPKQQQGAASALHAKWQEEGYVDRLSREDCEALSRGGFKINKDRDGFWAWWRERKLTHLWLAIGSEGWRCSRAPHPKGQWKILGNVYHPVIPYFPDYAVTPQAILRESLIVAVIAMHEHAPDKVFSEKFFAVAKELCDEAVLGLITDQVWFNDIVQQVTMVEPYNTSSQSENNESAFGEADHS